MNIIEYLIKMKNIEEQFLNFLDQTDDEDIALLFIKA